MWGVRGCVRSPLALRELTPRRESLNARTLRSDTTVSKQRVPRDPKFSIKQPAPLSGSHKNQTATPPLRYGFQWDTPSYRRGPMTQVPAIKFLLPGEGTTNVATAVAAVGIADLQATSTKAANADAGAKSIWLLTSKIIW